MEQYKEIERSIIKRFRKEIWSKFVKAVKEYQLINENDKIMVCMSGGKDSFLMAKCIQDMWLWILDIIRRIESILLRMLKS